MIFRKHGMNPDKSIRWHLNSDKKKKRIKLYPGPGNRKMTRFVSNSYSALYRIYFSKRGKRERKKEGTKIFNNLYSYSYWTPVAAGRTHHFSCTQRARTANRRLIQRAHATTRTRIGSTFRLTFVKQRTNPSAYATVIISELTDFLTRLTIFQIMTIISLPPPLLPSHPLPYPQPAWIFNIDKSPSSPPQSPSPGIHLSSGRFTKDISFGKSEDSSIYKIPVRKPRPWIVVLIFTTLFSHPPVGNVNIESCKSRNNLFNLVYLDSSINSSIPR